MSKEYLPWWSLEPILKVPSLYLYLNDVSAWQRTVSLRVTDDYPTPPAQRPTKLRYGGYTLFLEQGLGLGRCAPLNTLFSPDNGSTIVHEILSNEGRLIDGWQRTKRPRTRSFSL